MYKITIEDLEFECIIGILDFERVKPQKVVVDIDIYYKKVDEFINYADVVELIKSSMINSKYKLIEDALESLTKILKSNYHAIDEIELKITKPDILPDCKVSVTKLIKF